MRTFIIIICLLSVFQFACENDKNCELYTPDIVQIDDENPAMFNTKVHQRIKFIIAQNNEVELKVLSIINTLCPSNPGIDCFMAGYLIADFEVRKDFAKDTIQLRHGLSYLPDNSFSLDQDSSEVSFNNESYTIFLKNADYYTGVCPYLQLTMKIKEN